VALRESINRIQAWGEERDWRGFDPYDALNSPAAAALTLHTVRGRRVLTQIVKRAPVNLRPLLRIGPAWNAKAIGLVASGYARVWAATGEEHARREATRWLEWLLANPAADVDGPAWGYHFDVQTRFFFYPRGSANTIATAFAAQALLDGIELLGDDRFVAPALGVAEFLTSTMLVEQDDGPYFAYVPGDTQLIHNANVLACAVLARTGRLTGNEGLAATAAAALDVTLAAQRRDGSWPYAQAAQNGWVDNFHTGYVLESLVHFPEAEEALARGVAAWERDLFLADGTPKYTVGSTLPVDGHCYAQAAETWLAVGKLAAARREAELMVERMLDPQGFLWFQQRAAWTSKVPFVRWTTAPALRALAGLLRAEGGAAA
jgi:hypothetical protein